MIDEILFAFYFTFIDPNLNAEFNTIKHTRQSVNACVNTLLTLLIVITIVLIFYSSIAKQDSWEDEDEEPKEDEDKDPESEAKMVKKTKPQKDLKKRIAEKEVSFWPK